MKNAERLLIERAEQNASADHSAEKHADADEHE
jgi:hypothetical protein